VSLLTVSITRVMGIWVSFRQAATLECRSGAVAVTVMSMIHWPAGDAVDDRVTTKELVRSAGVKRCVCSMISLPRLIRMAPMR
jgi:hypothetical protein